VSSTARIRAALLAFGAAFALSIAGSQALVVAAVRWTAVGAGGPPGEAFRQFAVSSPGLMACGCFEGLLLLSIAVVSARLEGGPTRARLRLEGSDAGAPVIAALAALGLVGLTFACGAATELAGAGAGGVMDLLANALRRPSAGRFAIALVALCAVPAVGEELLFRGYIQPHLVASVGRWPGIALTAGAFGLFHRDPLQGWVAFVAGLFLGWTAERAGRVAPAIAAHAFNNAAALVVASWGAAGDSPFAGRVASVAVGAPVFALCAAGVARSTRRSR
jgi:membrane protease YdiL (CAAX protease family)